jgi:Protein of unknown function (DUF1353)
MFRVNHRLDRLLTFAIIPSLLVGCVPPTTESPPPNYGRFVGQVKTEWLNPDARSMRLLENFGYTDPDGKLWIAPADSIIDGASIPQAFWSIIGGPFEGEYRNASVVHDVACDRRKDPWQAVHRMFYFACLCGGVEPSKAKIMYAAVYHFGPRWKLQTEYEIIPAPSKTEPDTWVEAPAGRKVGQREKVPAPKPEQVRAITEYIRQHDPSLEEVERLDVSKIAGEQP